jgi:hypothetical protein
MAVIGEKDDGNREWRWQQGKSAMRRPSGHETRPAASCIQREAIFSIVEC